MVPPHGEGLSPSGVALGGTASHPWSLAWGTGADRVGLVIFQPAGEDAAQRWRALAVGPGDGGRRLTEATEALGSQTGAHLRVLGSPVPPASWGLGPAKMLLLPLLSGLTTWEGVWTVEPMRSTLSLDAPWSADGKLAADWFTPPGEPASLAASIPKAQTLTLRARVNPSKVLAIPSFLRSRFLPARIPGPLGDVLPPVEALLKLVKGDVALTLLRFLIASPCHW